MPSMLCLATRLLTRNNLTLYPPRHPIQCGKCDVEYNRKCFSTEPVREQSFRDDPNGTIVADPLEYFALTELVSSDQSRTTSELASHQLPDYRGERWTKSYNTGFPLITDKKSRTFQERERERERILNDTSAHSRLYSVNHVVWSSHDGQQTT